MTVRHFEGRAPMLEEGAWVDPTAVVIGDVHLGKEASIWPMSVLRGDINRIEIGARTNVQDGCIVHVTHASRFNSRGAPARIGDDVTVGHKAVLHACTIEERCLIGMGAVVLDEALIRREVIVGAGSVVPPGKELESGYLWLGVPARKVRPLSDEELEYLGYSAEFYAGLARQHAKGG